MRKHVEPVLLAVIAVAQIALFTRLLKTAYDFDEGVYLLSLEALRSGQELGTDVFAAQPPAFYWMLRAVAATVGDTGERVRLGVALFSLVGTGGAWFLARRVAGPAAGLLAAALLTISPPIPLFAFRVLADLPALWLVLAALAVGALASRRGSNAAAGIAGAIAVLAVATKLSAVFSLPVLAVILARDGGHAWRRLAWAAGGAGAMAVAIVAANARALDELWSSVVTYHRQAASTPPVIDRWASIGDLFNPRTPAFWLVVGGAGVFVVRVVSRRAGLIEFALWAWAFVAFAFLARFSPLHYNHLVALPVPLAVAAATSLGAQTAVVSSRSRAVVVAVLVVAVGAGYLQQWRRVAIAEEPQSQAELAAAATLGRVTRPGDFVVSDLPVSTVLADRLAPGPLVDAAFLRFETGSLTPEKALADIDRWCVAAVVAGRSFTRQPALLDGLAERFADVTTKSGSTVFSNPRRPCTPSR